MKFYHSYFIFCILQGEKGEQGLQGVPGAPGRDAGLFVFQALLTYIARN